MIIDANLIEGFKLGFGIGILSGMVLAFFAARLVFRSKWREIRKKTKELGIA